jgi:L-threonylcarbamoyladenylate synthase
MSPRAKPVCDESLSRAAYHLAAGRLGIVPTDTVYGICADARRDRAVARISGAKGRAESIPLQLLFAASIDLVGRYAQLSRPAVRLIARLGPGGWTIVCPAAPGWSSPALAGGRTVGFRMPDSTVVQRLVERLGGPLAASSANLHGQPSPTTCAAAVAGIGEHCSFALDAGPAPAALDSTVIDCCPPEPVILREGAIDRLEVARILGLSEIAVLRSVRR